MKCLECGGFSSCRICYTCQRVIIERRKWQKALQPLVDGIDKAEDIRPENLSMLIKSKSSDMGIDFWFGEKGDSE
jgi:hypothetical protein